MFAHSKGGRRVKQQGKLFQVKKEILSRKKIPYSSMSKDAVKATIIDLNIHKELNRVPPVGTLKRPI
jgi:hypothetical protein